MGNAEKQKEYNYNKSYQSKVNNSRANTISYMNDNF